MVRRQNERDMGALRLSTTAGELHGRDPLVFEVAWNSISGGMELQFGYITDYTTISLQEQHAGILTYTTNFPCSDGRRAFHDVLQFGFVCLWNDGFDTAKDLGVFQVLGKAACVSESSVQDIIQMTSHTP
jgi:hypothetical protein